MGRATRKCLHLDYLEQHYALPGFKAVGNQAAVGMPHQRGGLTATLPAALGTDSSTCGSESFVPTRGTGIPDCSPTDHFKTKYAGILK